MLFRETVVIYFEKILNGLFIFYAHIPTFFFSFCMYVRTLSITKVIKRRKLIKE